VSVLWIMSQSLRDATFNGSAFLHFPKLKHPALIQLVDPNEDYDRGAFERIVSFELADNVLDSKVIKGDRRFKTEQRALQRLSQQGKLYYPYETLLSLVKERFKTALINSPLLDAAILPLLNNPKWVDTRTLTPYWSCSGHFDETESEGGYLCLSGELSVLESILERFVGATNVGYRPNRFKDAEILFLSEPVDDQLLLHPTLLIRWNVITEMDIRLAISHLEVLLAQGIFDF